MSTVAFDTYAQFKQLVQTGVPAAQTEAIINAVAERLFYLTSRSWRLKPITWP